MNSYSLSTISPLNFDATLNKVIAILKELSFGVLTQIDVQAKMKEKINKALPPYLILGICHPPSAYEAIQAEADIGLFLPCNVLIREDEHGQVRVAAVRPSFVMSRMRNPKLLELAQRVEENLNQFITQL